MNPIGIFILAGVALGIAGIVYLAWQEDRENRKHTAPARRIHIRFW